MNEFWGKLMHLNAGGPNPRSFILRTLSKFCEILFFRNLSSEIIGRFGVGRRPTLLQGRPTGGGVQ